MLEFERLVRRLAGSVLASALIAGCGSGNFNQPDNKSIVSVPEMTGAGQQYRPNFGETVIGMSFSGGGMRASAFAYGVIKELNAHQTRNGKPGGSLIDNVVFVSGVSGGSVPAVYLALHGRDTVPSFRDKFLHKNPQSSFETEVSISSLLAILGGGLNSKTGFQSWLDKNLLHDATFGDLKRENSPLLWVNASDIYNDAVFTFSAETFAALCSDLNAYRLSEAVSAASAVPGVFSPIVIENFAGSCDYKEPKWVDRVLGSPDSPLVLKDRAAMLRRYQNREESRFIKLFDGGVTDNLGLYGLVTQRERYDSLIAPFSPEQVVKVKSFMFIVINAAAKAGENIQKDVNGPPGIQVLSSVVDTLMATATKRTRDDFFETMNEWRDDIVEYRCGLSRDRVAAIIGDQADWNCKDLFFDVLEISFEHVEDEVLRAKLQKIATAYVLPKDQTDLLVKTARELLQRDPKFQAFIKRVQ